MGQSGTAGGDPAALQGKGQPASVHTGLQQLPALPADGAGGRLFCRRAAEQGTAAPRLFRHV